MNSLRLWMICTILGHEFMTLHDMNNLVLWMTLTTRVSMSFVLLMLWKAQHYGWYEQFSIVNDINDSGSHELHTLNVVNNSTLWMIWTIPGRKPSALDGMNNSGLWMTWTTPGRELFSWYDQLKAIDDVNDLESHEYKALDASNNLGLCMIWMILEWELKVLDVVNTSRLWMTRTTLIHELRALNAMKY